MKSQVIDVVKLIAEHFDSNVKLVAFLPVKDFSANKKWIKERLPDALVFRIWFGMGSLRFNARRLWVLSKFINTDIIISRGVFATNLALAIRNKGRTQKVCFDGRGALKAEVAEYKQIKSKKISEIIPELESKAVHESDFRIAVTSQLVKFWEDEYDYKPGKEVVIPSTISITDDRSEDIVARLDSVVSVRRELGWGQYDIVLIYSGSVEPWQSMDVLHITLRHYLSNDSRVRVLFMSKEHDVIRSLRSEFPKQVQRIWKPHEEVFKYLTCGDYGLMIRKDSVTNRVASPNKFAEYLISGLRVLCSEDIGDYSAFVRKEEVGEVVTEENYQQLVLKPTTINDRKRIMALGFRNFSKLSSEVHEKYRILMEGLV